MAQDGNPKKPAETSESGVLASLPSTRPNRLGRRARADAPAGKPAATKKAPAKRKPAARRAAAKPKSKPKAKAVTPIAEAKPAADGPRPVRAGSPKLAERTGAAPRKPPPAAPEPPSGTDLAKTVVQAAGELAGVGLTVGGQVLKRIVERLPKP